jgi:K+-sensing histidine kinase KdpD
MTEERKIELQIPGDLPLVIADPELVGIAPWQLLSNAIKLTSPESARAIRARVLADSVAIGVAEWGREDSTSTTFVRQRVPY